MKLKMDFVTNSSSTGYIVALKPNELEEFEDYINYLDDKEEAANEGVRCYFKSDSYEELREYTNGGPLDWVDRACGQRFERMDQDNFERCKEIIDSGKAAAEVWVDYNACELFEEHFEDLNDLHPFC